MLLNIASIRECTLSEGIGCCFAILVQVCYKRCKNCCNTHLQPIIKKKHNDYVYYYRFNKKGKREA